MSDQLIVSGRISLHIEGELLEVEFEEVPIEDLYSAAMAYGLDRDPKPLWALSSGLERELV